MSQPILHTASLRAIETREAQAAPPLMDRAGAAGARIALDMLAEAGKTILIVAGPGNNGGDGFVVARCLRQSGHPVKVIFCGTADRLPADARRAHDAWLAAGGLIDTTFPEETPGLIVDALFGIGLSRPIEGIAREWIERINAASCPVLALDIPSGLDAETGVASAPTVRATATISLIALKPGLLTADGPDCCGRIVQDDLGLAIARADGELVARDHFREHLHPRDKNSHKGNYGNVAVIGGAPGMAGAALLCGSAALKLGAGRVYVGMLDNMAVDLEQPELMLRTPQEALPHGDVIAIGPGLGQSVQAGEMLSRCIDSGKPLILDADALTLLTQGTVLLRKLAVAPAPTFITPHPAEAARLLGTTTAQIQSARLASAQALAQRLRTHVVLKGCGSIVVAPDGHWFINSSGNPGLASAGTGDVLTGMLAALLAQGMPPLPALLCAVHLHGAAADECVAAGSGPVGLTAGELIVPARHLLNSWIDA